MLDDVAIAGLPNFNTYLGAWRNRPTSAERSIFEAHIGSGDTVFDIGANFGVMSILMARLAGISGCVHAFEPVPATFSALHENTSRNKCSTVHCHQLAV